MRILVNSSTAVAGGGVQRSASFIVNSISDPCGHEFAYAVSPMVLNQMRSLRCFSHKNIYEIAPSPVQLLAGKKSRHQLLEIKNKFKPDILFTTTAPSYTNFKGALEAAVVSDPFFTHPNQLALASYPRLDILKFKIKIVICKFFFRKVKYFFCQTKTSARGLAQRLNIPVENIFIISNCYNKIFHSSKDDIDNQQNELPSVFVLSHPYYHKNLDLVPLVASLLKERKIPLKFIMTLPDDNQITSKIFNEVQKLGVSDYIVNVKSLNLNECRSWYEKCDVVFLPTLLETFSATYVESMAMQKPLITTDLDFAKDVCGNAAEYFSPQNPEAAADAIIRVINNPARYRELVSNGLNQLKHFPDPHQQYLLQIKALEDCYEKSQKSKK